MTNANELIHSFNSTPDTEGNFNGLTKREYFAAMALHGLMANPIHSQKWSFTFIERLKDMFGFHAKVKASYASDLEKIAVKQADALINALNETK